MSNSTVRTHPVNVSYLVIGLLFLGLAGSWALREAGVVDLAEVRWLMPLTLVVAGLAGLVAAALKGLAPPGGEQAPDVPDMPDAQPDPHPDVDGGAR